MAIKTLLALVVLFGCTRQRLENQMKFAQELWDKGEYVGAASQFERTYRQDPQGTIGRRALYLAATTEALFLRRFEAAAKKLETFLEREGKSRDAVEAQKLLAKILAEELKRPLDAAKAYQSIMDFTESSGEKTIARHEFGRMLWLGGKLRDAEIELGIVAQSASGNAELEKRSLLDLGAVQFAIGEVEGCRRALVTWSKAEAHALTQAQKEDLKMMKAFCLETLGATAEADFLYGNLSNNPKYKRLISAKRKTKTEKPRAPKSGI